MDQALFKLGIEDSINILDERILQIIEDYHFYKYSAHLINDAVWKEAFILISLSEPRVF